VQRQGEVPRLGVLVRHGVAHEERVGAWHTTGTGRGRET
jgi:hypothetical protein